MHESIPPDSLLATRLANGYYTARLPRDIFSGVRPTEPNTLDQAEWDAYYVALHAHAAGRREWRLAGEPNYHLACVKHRTDRQEDFRADLIAALGLQFHHAGAALVVAAEETAKEWGASFANGCDDEYDSEAPLDGAELEQAAVIAVRFAALLA